MKVQEARQLGKQIAVLVLGRKQGAALDLLVPVLNESTPLRMLDAIGEQVGKVPRAASESCLTELTSI